MDYSMRCSLVLLFTALLGQRGIAQVPPLPVEATMRDLQARAAARQTNLTWYDCTPPSGAGPDYPPDGYYAAWFDDVNDAIILVSDIRSEFHSALGNKKWLRGSYQGPDGMPQCEWDVVCEVPACVDSGQSGQWSYTNNVDSDKGPTGYPSPAFFDADNSDFPNLLKTSTTIDANNYDDVFAAIQAYVPNMTHLIADAQWEIDWSKYATAAWSCGVPADCSDKSSCCACAYAEAFSDLQDDWSSQPFGQSGPIREVAWAVMGWDPNSEIYTISHLEYSSAYGRPEVDGSNHPLPGDITVYVEVHEYGEPIGTPPVTGDLTYRSLTTIMVDGSDDTVYGPTFGGGTSIDMPFDCSNEPGECADLGGWILENTIAIYQPNFVSKVDCPVDCGGDAEVHDLRDPIPSETCEGEACEECGVDETAEPVSLRAGHKVERVTDAVVRVTGRDFELVREYTSDPAFGTGVVGYGWFMSAFEFADVPGAGSTGDIKIYGPPLHAHSRFEYVMAEDAWISKGPTTRRVERSSYELDGVNYPAFAVYDPGKPTEYYYRERESIGESGLVMPDSRLIGLKIAEVDFYSENHWVYQYVLPSGGTNDHARLCCIYLNPIPNTFVGAEARVFFHWFLDSSDPNNLEGHLRKVTVERYNEEAGSNELLVKQEIEYLYGDSPELSGITVHADTSTVGENLILVRRSIAIDQAPVNVEKVWTRYWHYRYHDGNNESGPDGTEGDTHQLKAAFLPEQIEYYGQQAAADETWASDEALHEAAEKLIGLSDSTVITAWADGTDPAVIDLAAKIVGYDDASPYRVEVQYLQSACGCGVGGSQGLKQDFAYATYNWSGTGDGWSVHITETSWNGSAWSAYRTVHHDYKRLDPWSSLYKHYNAIESDLGDGRVWAWSREYNATNRTLEEVYTPSAIQSYTVQAGTSPPGATYTASQGLAHQYTWTSDFRPAGVLVRDSGGTFRKVNETTYHGTYSFLPTQIKRYRVESTPGADDIETMDLEYTLHADGSVESIATKVETERYQENGPTTSGQYETIEVFDQFGNNTWSRAADGSATHRVYASVTGSLIAVVRNADPDGGTIGSYVYSSLASFDTSDWGRTAEGGELLTQYSHDDLGRVIQRTEPGGVATYTVRELRENSERDGLLYLAEVTLPYDIDGNDTDFNGPASVVWYDADRHAIRSSDYEVSSHNDLGGATATYTLGDEIARSTTDHTYTGLVESTRRWHDTEGDYFTTEADRFYETEYAYDELGRVEFVTNDNGTVTHNADYDALNRVLEVKVGTSTSNTETVAKYYYDDPDNTTGDSDREQGVGNGNLSWIETFTGESGVVRRTLNIYDHRDRRVMTINPEAPHEVLVYDNLDRVTERAMFETTPTDIDTPLADRGLYSQTHYSQRGLAFKTAVAIDPTAGSPTFLESHQWFDEVGRTIGQWSPNSPGTKTEYDGLGRVTTTYVTDRSGDLVPGVSDNYDDVASLTGGFVRGVDLTDDRVLEQTTYRYTDADRVDLVTRRVRLHDASESTDTGALVDSTSVTTFVGMVYDGAQRQAATINYGTNLGTGSSNDIFKKGGTAPTVPTTVPGSPPTDTLMTVTEYDTRGLVETVTAPDSTQTRYLYDDLSRRIAVIENYVDAAIDWDDAPGVGPDRWMISGLSTTVFDEDRATTFVYDGADNIVLQVAHVRDDGTGDDEVQTTQYVYGVEAGSEANDLDSLVYSNDLLSKVHYPDESTGAPNTGSAFTVTYAYNRLGELRGVEDQNGTIHTYDRDLLGRVEADTVTNVGTNIDDDIERIDVDYDALGRLDWAKSYEDTAATTIANAVQFEYTPLWQVSRVLQDVDGEIQLSGGEPTGNTRAVEYEYANAAIPASGTGADNRSRLHRLIYPSEVEHGDIRTCSYVYGTTGTINDRISRLGEIHRDFDPGIGGGQSAAGIAEYGYVGLGMHAVVEYPEIDVLLDRTYRHSGERNSSGQSDFSGEYPGWDRFARVVRHAWIDGESAPGQNSLPAVPPILEELYAYDEASNRTQRYDDRPKALKSTSDFQFLYDGLDRLEEERRGVDDSGWTWGKGSHKWALDMLGNWNIYHTDENNNGIFGQLGDTKDTRAHNEANELTQQVITGSGSGTNNHTLDAAGNLRQVSPAGSSAGTRYTHDAWNRLVKVEILDTSGDPLAYPSEYEYNSLHWRTIRRSKKDSAHQERRMYYTASWQLCEERIDDDNSGGFSAERIAQQFWGQRYIDDAILRRIDANADGDFTDGGDGAWFHITDVQFSSVALLDDTADLAERVVYDAYGNARHSWPEDLDGDGDVDTADQTIFDAAYNMGSPYEIDVDAEYNVDADFDRDGDVDSADQARLTNALTTAALANGLISDEDGPGNVIGYDGYVFNAVQSLYTVRFRTYQPETGRWLERDPIDYADGMNLFEFVNSMPVVLIDSAGLCGCEPPPDARTGDNSLTSRMMNCKTRCEREFLAEPLRSTGARQRLADCKRKCDRQFRGTPFYTCYRTLNTNGASLIDTAIIKTADTFEKHSFIAFRPDPELTWAYTMQGHEKKGDLPSREAGFPGKDAKCYRCFRTDSYLVYGSGANAKTGMTATYEEIKDCIKNATFKKDYDAFGYNCNTWRPDTLAECGLRCDKPQDIQHKILAPDFVPTKTVKLK